MGIVLLKVRRWDFHCALEERAALKMLAQISRRKTRRLVPPVSESLRVCLSICSVSPPPTSVSPLLCLLCKSIWCALLVCASPPRRVTGASGPNRIQAGRGHGATRSLHSVTPEGPLPCEKDARRPLHVNRWQEPS